ncbi:hypothetical protein SLE2022_004510 [Rubroshorea leprosula]
MKASMKFRDEQKPLLRAKVPLSILGLPFQSGIVAGESKELTLNLATFFESGPSIKLAYRPNDTWNPFSVVVKTGTGSFGSPMSSSMLMSAEFSLLRGGNPSFMLHFKPRFGDFSIKKVQSSVFDKAATSHNGFASEDDSSIEMVEPAMVNGCGFHQQSKKIMALQAGDFTGILSGMEVSAKTALPVKGRAVVNFRWGVRVPAEMKSGFAGGNYPTTGISFKKVPFLVMDKIGIEYVDGTDSKGSSATTKAATAGPDWGSTHMAEACFAVKHQLEILQAENSLLKKAVDDLRQEIAAGKMGDFITPKYREIERSGISSKSSSNKFERRNNEKKSMEGDVNEELKKALKGATPA